MYLRPQEIWEILHVRTQAKWPFLTIFGVIQESFFRQQKSRGFEAKFRQAL